MPVEIGRHLLAAGPLVLAPGRRHSEHGSGVSFYINGIKVGSANDGLFKEGTFAISVQTFDLKGAGAYFENLTVRLADPANPPE